MLFNYHCKLYDKSMLLPFERFFNHLLNTNTHVWIARTCGLEVCDNDPIHYNDVILTTMASEITSLTVVYSTVYSDADQRKHQSSASLAFVWGIHRDRWIPRTKGQLRGKCFHLMTPSCKAGKRHSLQCNTGLGWFTIKYQNNKYSPCYHTCWVLEKM